MTSCIDWPRTAIGDCSPSAQRTASVMFDLPDPFGPTITLTPAPNSSRVRSGNDLKPLIVIDFRCISVAHLRLHRLERGLRGLLLGVLLAATTAAADLYAADPGADGERPVVRRPLLGGDDVAHGLAALGEARPVARRLNSRGVV